MKRNYSLLFILLMVFSLASSAYAQRGGDNTGGRGGRGGDGTPTAPQINLPNTDNTAQIQLPTGERSADSFTMPENWGEFTLPENLPSSPEDIQQMLSELELPIDLESIEFGASSPEAYAAIVGFGQSYLGIYIDPFYAGDLSPENMPTGDLPQEIPVEVSSMSRQLPTEVQTMMDNASGMPYWGLWDTGVAAVYTDIVCESANCSIDIENLQVSISSASLGAYVFYQQASANDTNSAYNLILNTYPGLAGYQFEPYAVETGYAFAAYTLDVQGGNVSAAVAGVVNAGSGQSIVYAIYGVGEAYVNIIR